MRALHSTLAAAGLGLCFAAARAPLARDLDVGLPPGSPLEWSASFPVYTPADEPLFPVTRGEEASADETRTVAASRKDADVRFANAFGQVRILTWDLGAHLVWTKAPLPPGTARDELRPPPPGFGEPLYWLSLAPLLRLLLHPDALARSETLAHLVELGEPVLPVLGAAANERALAQACRELSALIPLDRTPLPTAPAGASPRDAMLARFVLEECLRDEPLDPSDDFGRRLYLFAEEAEPLLVAYAQHPSLALARNAVAALGRYRTRTAQEFLASLAARATDPVIVVRALAALGRHPGALEVRPLVARLQRTDEPVQRAALVGALGRSGAQAAAPALLALGETARRERDSDLLISVLSALARISWTRPEPELATFCERIGEEARTLGRAQELEQKPDLPDPPTLRAEILSQLALLAHSQAAPADEEVREAILALARPAPLDARLSELGVGGTDPLGSIPAAVRFLYLEALRRAGPAGLEQLAALVRRSELDTALRARVLALLPADQRDAQALALLDDARNPVELRIAALEVLISDLHPRVWELARAQLVAPAPESAWSSAGEHFLAMRAVRFLSEARRLEARELLPLFPIVQRPPAEREAQVAELREGVSELVAAARDGERAAELRARVAALVDFVIAHHLNTLFDGEGRDARIDLLVESLASARLKEEAERTALAGVLLAQLLGGEADLSWVSFEIRDPGRRLFRPSVPLAEEVLLALGRTREPLALELVLSVLAGGARELRGHACLALAMCGEPAVAEQLLPALLDPEPFVRFAASEALRHLTGKQAGIDWMAAPPAERRAAAEELKRGFLEAR